MVVVKSIGVSCTADGTSYTGPYPETWEPSETAMDMGIEVQPETSEYPGTEVGSFQSLLVLQSSSNMHLLFSPS